MSLYPLEHRVESMFDVDPEDVWNIRVALALRPWAEALGTVMSLILRDCVQAEPGLGSLG